MFITIVNKRKFHRFLHGCGLFPAEAVRAERSSSTFNGDAPVEGIYLRIIIHDNEHIGQLVAYARMTGVVPAVVEVAGSLESLRLPRFPPWNPRRCWRRGTLWAIQA